MEVAQIASSVFYYHLKRLGNDKYTEEKKVIKKIYHKHYSRYGYRRITMEMRKEKYVKESGGGYKFINHKTVYRLMRELNIKSMVRPKKYKSYKGEVGVAADNLLNRNFSADNPFEKWVTDVTEFRIKGHRIYLSPIMDLYNSEIISSIISFTPNFKMVRKMMKKALWKLPAEYKLMIHSDQGFHYTSLKFQELLKENRITQSMSRRGNCYDNATIENFFGILKSEFLYLKKFDSVEQFIKELKEYIKYYNNDRIKAKLNGLSPVEYRLTNNIII